MNHRTVEVFLLNFFTFVFLLSGHLIAVM